MIYRTAYNILQHVCLPMILTSQCPVNQLMKLSVAINADLNNIREWLLSNRLSLNLVKTEYLLIGSRHNINTLEEQPWCFYWG